MIHDVMFAPFTRERGSEYPIRTTEHYHISTADVGNTIVVADTREEAIAYAKERFDDMLSRTTGDDERELLFASYDPATGCWTSLFVLDDEMMAGGLTVIPFLPESGEPHCRLCAIERAMYDGETPESLGVVAS